jgi:hypothetical protein
LPGTGPGRSLEGPRECRHRSSDAPAR